MSLDATITDTEIKDAKWVISKRKDDKHAALHPRQVIKLNIGGVFYDTTADTLSNFPHSVLAHLTSGRVFDTAQLVDGRIFIDRNGKLFKYILDYCRELELPSLELKVPLKDLWKEARYYGLDDLQKQLEDRGTRCKHCGISSFDCKTPSGKCKANKTVHHQVLKDSILMVIPKGELTQARVRVESAYGLSRFTVREIDEDGQPKQKINAWGHERDARSFTIHKDQIQSTVKCALCDAKEPLDKVVLANLKRCKASHEFVRSSQLKVLKKNKRKASPDADSNAKKPKKIETLT